MYQVTIYVPQESFQMVLHAIKSAGGGRFKSSSWRLSYKLMFTMSADVSKKEKEVTESQYEISFPCNEKFVKTVINSVQLVCDTMYYVVTPILGMGETESAKGRSKKRTHSKANPKMKLSVASGL